MAFDLTGTVALVTGASSGIGTAIAETLAGAGVKVALVGRREQRLREVADRIGSAASVVVADVSDAAQAEAAIASTVAQQGGLDILVNNAGVMLNGPVAEAPVEEWQRMLGTNLNGMLYCARAALPHLAAAARHERGIADIVNISSISGRKIIENSAVYTASKMAVGGFSEGARSEFAQLGVRISLIEPGPTSSELLEQLRSEVRDELMRHIAEGPTFRPLEPSDIADAVLFVVSRKPGVAINEVMLRPTLSPF